MFTDGESLLATRYVTQNADKAHSLYYTLSLPGNESKQGEATANNIVIASERVDSLHENWTEVPHNHALIVSNDLTVALVAL